MSNATDLKKILAELSETSQLVRQMVANRAPTITATITAAAPAQAAEAAPSELSEPATLREFAATLDRLPTKERAKYYARFSHKFFNDFGSVQDEIRAKREAARDAEREARIEKLKANLT